MIRGGRTDGGRRRKGEEGENARRMLELEGPTSGVAGGARGLLSFFYLFFNSRNRERDRDWAWYDCRVLETKNTRHRHHYHPHVMKEIVMKV